MGQGKGVRPVVTVGGGPAARLFVFPPLAGFALAFVQEGAEEWMIKFVAPASDA
jgi:hypothetical protein